jgi:hypothetical protein
MTKDRHKLSPIWEGSFQVMEVTQPVLHRLQREDGSEIPNSWNIDLLRMVLYVGNCVYIFSFLSVALTYKLNRRARGL